MPRKAAETATVDDEMLELENDSGEGDDEQQGEEELEDFDPESLALIPEEQREQYRLAPDEYNQLPERLQTQVKNNRKGMSQAFMSRADLERDAQAIRDENEQHRQWLQNQIALSQQAAQPPQAASPYSEEDFIVAQALKEVQSELGLGPNDVMDVEQTIRVNTRLSNVLGKLQAQRVNAPVLEISSKPMIQAEVDNLPSETAQTYFREKVADLDLNKRLDPNELAKLRREAVGYAIEQGDYQPDGPRQKPQQFETPGGRQQTSFRLTEAQYKEAVDFNNLYGWPEGLSPSSSRRAVEDHVLSSIQNVKDRRAGR